MVQQSSTHKWLPQSAANDGPRFLAVANQKGGVGKTTTAVNLSTALAAVGKKVLLIDLDPQGNASTGLGLNRADRQGSSYDLLFGGRDALDTTHRTKVPRLDVIPSSIHLSGADIELVNMKRREFRMRDALRGQPLNYDYVLIDCPPSLSLTTLNALTATDGVIVPLQCEFYALEGLSQLVRTIERVKKHYNPTLEIQGLVLTMFDKRNNLAHMVAEDVRKYFGDKVYQTVIPRNVRISEAPSYGLPAIIYDMRCSGSQGYIQLAKELIRREKTLSKSVAQQKVA
tara:strand:+ start:1610 stop:2464 length:855 start_codon:yes stop_codon:yes gene_type:complete